MVSKEQIEEILNNIINPNLETETDKCGGGSSSGSGGGSKKKPKKKPKKSNKPKLEDFDEKNFTQEEYTSSQNAHPSYSDIDYDWESPQGKLQRIQSELQEDINYTHEDDVVAHSWSTNLFYHLNCYLYDKADKHGTRWGASDEGAYDWDNDKEYTLKQSSGMLSKAIQKSPKSQDAFVTYKFGPVDEFLDMEVGDTGAFKGFNSTSFNYSVPQNALKKQVGGWFRDGGSNRAMIRFFNPKGTTGMVIDETVKCHDWQSEWLLDKGQKYMLVGKGPVTIDGEEVYTYDVLLYD